MTPEVAVLNFGIGNVSSVVRACKYLGVKAVLTNESKVLQQAKRLIVPGDGAFGGTLKELARYKLIDPILKFVKSGRPFLGICVGMQILADFGEEFGHHAGLKLIPGKVDRFRNSPGYKIPQIGWNQLHKSDALWNQSILEETRPKSWVYFVHSYVFVPKEKKHILATTKYAGEVYCSVVKKGNITGTQFHPEKSGLVGLTMLKHFLSE